MLALSTGIAAHHPFQSAGAQAATFHNPGHHHYFAAKVRIQRNIVNGTDGTTAAGALIATPQPYR